ncbi:hypothetical protein KDD17_02595 [Sulfitobacter albidus]|uniref:MobA/VirD2-like nuclease domain-containing protein n=1 Tax=Sulfitobacter albidus TaxID=2829501 RepID=A0A975JEG7_9RHOB|nr:hypothetical protein [Sulfitobacter albidus]QUJ76958.1 hypothetical protein KDD17_02595 [Sulfitobacter albidus]
MRPHLTWHGDPDKVNRYINKPDAEPIGGTIPNFGNRDLFQRFRGMILGDPRPEPILHMTLSLPKGAKATKMVWVKLIAAALKVLGLDPEMTPWFSKRHQDTDCDHVHTAITLRDFAGRPLSVSGSAAKAEKTHRHLCAMLGLPTPVYFDPEGAARLNPVTPKRRLAEAHLKALHTDLREVFSKRQPETLSDLNAGLFKCAAGYQVKMTSNVHGVSAFQFDNGEASVFGGELGKAWEPRHLNNLLRLTGKLRRVRDALDLNQLVQIFNTPYMETIVANIINRPEPDRTTVRLADHPQPDRNDGQPCPRPARPAGLTGSAGRSERVPWRDASKAVAESDRSTGPVSSRTHTLGGADEQGGRTKQESFSNHSGKPTAAGVQNGPVAEDLEDPSRITFGSLLAKVCAIAAKRLPGWRLSPVKGHTQIAVKFSDQSGVVVSPHNVQIVRDGAEAFAFREDFEPSIKPHELDEAKVVDRDNDFDF